MKAEIHGLDGKKTGKKELPRVFDTPHRPDLIKRAVVAYQAARRQAYGSNPMAGKRTSAHYEGNRHLPPSQRMMNREMSRIPRIHGDAPGGMFMRARFAPHAVKGRAAHPPKASKEFDQKMNKKERKLAIKSAVAATADQELVKERGHRHEDVPLIVSDDIQTINRTQDLRQALEALGLGEELERVSDRRIRAGRGKNRGRKYKTRTGPLLVVAEDGGVSKAAANIQGVDVATLDTLNAEHLSPGAHGARLTLWSESALEELEERYEK